MLGKIEGRRRRGRQRMRWSDGITFNGHEFEQTLGDSGQPGLVVVHGVAKSQTQLSNKKRLIFTVRKLYFNKPDFTKEGGRGVVSSLAGLCHVYLATPLTPSA